MIVFASWVGGCEFSTTSWVTSAATVTTEELLDAQARLFDEHLAQVGVGRPKHWCDEQDVTELLNRLPRCQTSGCDEPACESGDCRGHGRARDAADDEQIAADREDV